DVAVLAAGDGRARAPLAEAVHMGVEPGADAVHRQAVEPAYLHEVVKEPVGLGIEETAGRSLSLVTDRLEEEVAGAVVAVPLDLDRDNTQVALAVHDTPQ